jgi:AraC family transcriptional regulator, transcriptional activator of pobA
VEPRANLIAVLEQAVSRLRFEPYALDRPIDARGRYPHQLDRAFPFEIKPLLYSGARPNWPATWHEYLELFVTVSGRGQIQLAGTTLDVAAGDVLVMDHLSLHAVVQVYGPEMRALVIRFMPDFVRGLSASMIDHLFLTPFYCRVPDRPHLLRANETDAAAVHRALADLLAAHFGSDPAPYRASGSKAHFLVLLHLLARHFRSSEALQAAYARQQQKAVRLKAVFAFIDGHFDERITIDRAARLARLSRAQFTKLFRESTGTTFVDHLLKVRLGHAARMLRESHVAVADVAMKVGFSDPSYFDRRFRRHFGQTPLAYRSKPVPSVI